MAVFGRMARRDAFRTIMPPAIAIPLSLAFPLLMIFAAVSDMLTMRISNRLVGLVVLSFFVLAFAVGLPLETIGLHLLAGAAVLLVAFSFFALRWIGGGDAKLMAATALWFGFGELLPYVIYASLLGGALTLLLLLVRRWPLPAALGRQDWIARLHNAGTGIPYGIALALAGLLVYPRSLVFVRLLG